VNTFRVLAALGLGLAPLGCNESPNSQPDAGVPRTFPGAEHLAVHASGIFELPRVLDLSKETIDGVPVELEVGDNTLDVAFTDLVGRDVAFHIDGKGTEPWDGEIRWCLGDDCATETLRAQRLWTEDGSTHGFRVLSEVRGDWERARVLAVAARGGVAVVSLGVLGFAVVDVSHPETPRILNEWRPNNDGEAINDVELIGSRWLLAASSDRGLRVFDLGDPAAPLPVFDSLPLGVRNGHTLFVDERRVYVARVGFEGGLDVFDLRDPAAPRVLASLSVDGCREVHEVFARDALLLVSCLDEGLVALALEGDLGVDDFGTPRVVARWPGEGVHSALLLDDGQTVLVTSERFAGPLEFLDLDLEKGSFSHLATFSLGIGASTHEVRCRGARCWLCHYQEGFLELDVSVLDEPKVTRRFPSWNLAGKFFFEGASGAMVREGVAYLADTERGLIMLATE
jgi:hypothetical protein